MSADNIIKVMADDLRQAESDALSECPNVSTDTEPKPHENSARNNLFDIGV